MPLWNNTIHFEFNSLPGQLKGDPYFLSCYYFLFLSYVLIAISTIIVTASDFQHVIEKKQKIKKVEAKPLNVQPVLPVQEIKPSLYKQELLKKIRKLLYKSQEIEYLPLDQNEKKVEQKKQPVQEKSIEKKEEPEFGWMNIFKCFSLPNILADLIKQKTQIPDVISGVRFWSCVGFIVGIYFQQNQPIQFPQDKFQAFLMKNMTQVIDIILFCCAFLNLIRLDEYYTPRSLLKFPIGFISYFFQGFPIFYFVLIYWWKFNPLLDNVPNFQQTDLFKWSGGQACKEALTLELTSKLCECYEYFWFYRTELIMFCTIPLFAAISAKLTPIANLPVIFLLEGQVHSNCISNSFSKNYTMPEEPPAYSGNDNHVYLFQLIQIINQDFDFQSKLGVYLLGLYFASIYLFYEKTLAFYFKPLVSFLQVPITLCCYYIGYEQIVQPLKDIFDYRSPFIKNGSTGLQWISIGETYCSFKFRILLGLGTILIPALIGLNDPLGSLLKIRIWKFFDKLFLIVILISPIIQWYLKFTDTGVKNPTVFNVVERIFSVDGRLIVQIAYIFAIWVQLPLMNIFKLFAG